MLFDVYGRGLFWSRFLYMSTMILPLVLTSSSVRSKADASSPRWKYGPQSLSAELRDLLRLG